jgi:uncharacterized RDD family membrane protein YckC
MSAEPGDRPPRPEAPETGEPSVYDGRADAHARARSTAQAMAAARRAAEDRAVTPPPRAPEDLPTPSYAGLVTRAIAFAVDAIAINTAAVATGAVVGLALSLLNAPSATTEWVAAIGGAVYLIWTATYFVTFWSTTGETPGARLMRIRVLDARDAAVRLRPRRALVRLLGMTLSAIPLFAGFLLVLFDDRRRGLHDRLARTVVVYVPDERVAPRA